MKTSLSIRSANGLFLVSILLVLTLGSLMQVLHFGLGLIGTELLCVLLPALLFMRLQRVDIKAGLRLRQLSWRAGLICLALGLGGWLLAGYIDVFIMQITGLPPVDIPPSMLPDTPVEGALFAAGLVIFAPLCEEALFRGVIQGAYEQRRTAVAAIVFSSLMFAFYHFRLTGLPALLPLAFLFGYIVWRTQSLYAGILAHFGNNLLAATFSLLGLFSPGTQLPIPSVAGALVGLVILAAGLWALHRVAPAPPERQAPEEPPQSQEKPGWLRVYWPLLVAGLLYVVITGLQLAVSLNPQLAA